MNYEDIKVDERYRIWWLDPDYPCDCKCHDDPSIKHLTPCCYDHTYTGLATCTRKDDRTQKITMMIDEKIGGDWYLCISAEDVLDKLQK